ncbi:MAG TPA: sulfotransferase [Candidatus Binatia bacterium]|nr:sulfotransferase [Candidatus Binatia bacterium]
MQDRLIFLIGAPRSGTTLLARMLGAHSMIYQRAEPHLITPIAHLGYYGKVQKAPYDPNNVDQAIHEFVADLPRGEADYLEALRAYTDTMYERIMARAAGKRFFLDKTPAYALVLPFLVKLYPQARYVVLTRHPLAVLSSYVESFFDGDWEVATAHNPILARYVPALAALLRDRPVPCVHVRYEELVRDPETHFRRVCEHLGVPFEADAIAYGERGDAPKGLGDPIGVGRHTRPVTTSVSRWAAEIANDAPTLALVSRLLDELDPADLEMLGYPRAQIVAQLEAAKGAPVPARAAAPLRYRLERKALVALRRNIHRNALGRVLKRVRFALDVLLRE